MSAAETIYLLSGLTSLAAAWLLLRYYRARRTKLLLWSVVGFAGLALNNVLVFADLVMFPHVDLSVARTLPGTAGMLALLYGLIWETRRP
jgi:hypothetical protein